MLISPLIAEHSNKNLVVLYRLNIHYIAKIDAITNASLKVSSLFEVKLRKSLEKGPNVENENYKVFTETFR